jgi:predicted DNA-binding protein (MmcQ/YjbR family)
MVFKVMGKMFTLADVIEFTSINLKCDPETGAELRERYPAVQPGYHMNKKHWITVSMDGSVPEKLIKAWIEASYDLVVSGFSKSEKLTLGSL